jgi:hypothetical protein
MKLTPTTPEAIKENEAGNYNISVWKQTVSRYEKYNADFYISDKREYNSDMFYAVYIADGIRFIKEISFSSSLTSSPLQMVMLEENGELKLTDHFYPKTENGRALARKMTKLHNKIIFQ